MNRKPLHRFVTMALVILIIAVDIAVPQPVGGVEQAQASTSGVNVVVGFFRIIGAGNQRRRVYREAANTQQEMNAYYDNLIAKTRSIREELTSNVATGDTPPRFIRAYVRIEAALQAEHAAVTQQIEAEKNQARRDFNRALGQEIVNILIASPGGQQLIGRVRDTLNGLREAAAAVQAAANDGKPLETLIENLASRHSEIPPLRNAVRNLGSMVGHKLDQALGGILSQVENAMDDVAGQMGQAVDLVNELDATVAQYHEQERRPISLTEDDGSLRELIPVDRANAALDVAADAYAGAAALHGALESGTSRGDMRDRIRSTLLQQRLEGCDLTLAEHDAGQTFCSGVSQSQYEAAARQLGLTVETPRSPEESRYLVCYHIQTGVPVYAYMVGSAAEATPTPGGPTPTPTPTPETRGQAAVAMGAFLEGCEESDVTTGNTLEMEFYPEGGPVLGNGVIQCYGYTTDTREDYHTTFEFQGQSDPSGKAGGSVEISQGGVVGEYTWEDTLGTLQWEAEFTDGVFEGYIWNPKLPEILFLEFSLTY